MNTNIMNQKGYYANVKSTGTDGIYWGFSVREERGTAFTTELAKELLALANAEYKKAVHRGIMNLLTILIKILYISDLICQTTMM